MQWSFDWWCSLGIHIDCRRRDTYGPYVDFHLGPAILSLGGRPVYTDDVELLLFGSRGGIHQ